MKVAVPSYSPGGLDAPVSPHFGRCEVFTIVEVEDGEIKGVQVVPNTSSHFGGAMTPAQLLITMGVDAILTPGLGRRALALLENSRVKAYIVDAPTVRDAVRKLISGDIKVASMEEACPGRKHHEHEWG